MTNNLERELRERLLARSHVSPRDVDALRVFARTVPARRLTWPRPALRWVLPAAAIALAIAVAVPLLVRIPGFGTTPTPTPPAATQPIVPEPTILATEGARHIRLQTGSGAAVYVTIHDPSHLLDAVGADQSDQTMSVRWFDSVVEDGGTPGTLRVSWAGFRMDEEVQLDVKQLGNGRIELLIAQTAPPLQSDAEGEDRELLFDFAGQVEPNQVVVAFRPPGTSAVPPLPSERAMENVVHDLDALVRGSAANRGGATITRLFDATVEQVSPTRIAVSWAGFAEDEIVDATVSLGPTGRVQIEIQQDVHVTREDRTLTLELDRIVLASEVIVTFAPLPGP